MPEYRISYHEVPWHIIFATFTVKFWFTFVSNPIDWIKKAKYYRKRRRILYPIGWFLVAAIIWTAFEFFCRIVLNQSATFVISDFINFILE